MIGLTLLAAGCGGSSGAKVAQVGTTNSASGPGTSNTPGSGDLKAYSACMRGHHVPNFPDPGADGSIQLGPAIDQGTPTYQAASRACRALAPGGPLTEQTVAQIQRQMLALAACMRSHGVPKFPDPVLTHGHIRFEPDHIDVHSPVFTAAAATCQRKLSPNYSGYFTRLFPQGPGGRSGGK